MMGCRGKAVQHGTGVIMGCLKEEAGGAGEGQGGI